ncbi:hypothetical protein V474_22745 [Novosphingobium barchaimii LL02]|uniref:Uncharacterized protein n=1 Tax=Novosphingobium barchaimii LL02 TaxID=1114963 RepID=A0A0J7XPK2_9SPHN|nr:hypothetical protein [Novosphingobium barchaimii]KMS53602.1 hypothetical protein V474_22745 [Novosphingobium barchaimii LL02]
MTTSSRLTAHREKNGTDLRTGLPLAAGAPRRFDNFQARLSAPLPGAINTKPGAAAHQSTTQTPAQPPAAAPKVPAMSQAEIARTRRAERHDAVMGSIAARGRQLTAKALLEAKENYTTAQILGSLASMPTDADIRAKAKREASDAVWDRARFGAEARRSAPAANAENGSRKASGAVWDRAYGRAATDAPALVPKHGPAIGRAAADAVWDRVNARMEAHRRIYS